MLGSDLYWGAPSNIIHRSNTHGGSFYLCTNWVVVCNDCLTADAQSDTLISGLVPLQSTQGFWQFSTVFPCLCCKCGTRSYTAVFSWVVIGSCLSHLGNWVAFFRGKTFVKTIASKQSLREAVRKCTELKDSWTIKSIWADMMPAHLMSAEHSQTRCHRFAQIGLMEHSADMHVT